jgi:hypothetical protein
MSDERKMTATERKDLAVLARKRAKLLKTATAERRAEVMADFEAQLGSIYTGDDDAAMKRLRMAAEAAADEVGKRLAEHCEELGIPARFAPSLSLYWHGRGENAIRDRRAELRTVVRTRLDALEKRAKTAIDAACLETEERLIADGLTTEAAQAFLAGMPTPEELMPRLDLSEIAQLLPRHTREKADDLAALRATARRLTGGDGA